MNTNILKTIRKFVKELQEDYKDRETFNRKNDLLIKESFKDINDKELREEAITNFRNFVEKLAVWYELKYPSSLLNSLDFKEQEFILGKEEYNTNTFLNSLSLGERNLIEKPTYPPLAYLSKQEGTYVLLDEDGIITNAQSVFYPSPYFLVTKEYIVGKEFEGMSITKAMDYFQSKGLITANSDIEKIISRYETDWFKRESLIECVIYRILEKGKNYTSLMRACLFAHEFGGNLAIPLKYGLFYHHPEVKPFINEYLKSGGSKDLVCLENYFHDQYTREKFEKTTLQEIIKYFNSGDCYTKEEFEIGKELIKVLKIKLNDKKIEKEEAKQKRIERNLEKSRKRVNI